MLFAGLKTVIEPTSEPITVADVRAQARVDFTDEDSLIGGSYIRAAREYVEQATRRAMMPQTLRFSMRNWPGRDYTNGPRYYSTLAEYYRWNYFQLPKPPLVSVVSITYLDSSNATTAMTLGTDYILDLDSEPGRVYLPFAMVWPTAVLQTGSPIKVTYTAGYPAYAGTVTTVGQTVTWASGDKFDPSLQGSFININGTSLGVLAITDDQHLVLVKPSDDSAAPLAYSANAIPVRFKQAMIMLASYYYTAARESVVVGKTTAISSKELEMGVSDLIGLPVRMDA